MKQERPAMEPKWWRLVPFALALLGLIPLIAGVVPSQVGRMMLQIAVACLVLSWLAIWMWSRRDPEGRPRLRLHRK